MMLEQIGINAKKAANELARASTYQKNAAIERLADRIIARENDIIAANQQDVKAAIESGLSAAMIDRLMLNAARLKGMSADLFGLLDLPDPVGEVFEENRLINGLLVRKQRVPLGVLAVIYEARPNVTLDVAGLAIKSGNSVILRGGSETIHSNRILVQIVREALCESNLPEDAVQFIDNPDRALVQELLKLHQYVDMVIPRGGAALHRFCRENSLIPVITGGIGICHLYVDDTAPIDESIAVIRNAKIQRPTVCNALDTVLLHRSIARTFLPSLLEKLENDGVTFRLDERAMQMVSDALPKSAMPAGVDDFDTEWLSLVLGIGIVDHMEEAIAHIAQHSTGHSDGILTQNMERAEKFIAEVDSAAVYVNASTRFTDGAQLGLGAEVAISTQRLHARGPMGLRELTTYKWVVQGNYHVRS